MNRTFFLLLLLYPSFSLPAQSLLSKFARLSTPEKCWTLLHPFVARKAFHATVQSQHITDSIKSSAVIGLDNSGGQLDAFKHAYWIASVSNAIGPRKALKLGRAHEKGNWIQFKKHRLEDQELPDSVSSCMDLFNNEQGARAVKEQPGMTTIQLQKKIMELLLTGELRCILKNGKGQYLTCDGSVIIVKEWFGKWNVPKCLVVSNAAMLQR